MANRNVETVSHFYSSNCRKLKNKIIERNTIIRDKIKIETKVATRWKLKHIGAIKRKYGGRRNATF